MSDLDKSKLNITVLVSSYSQRDITIETAIYYSRICSEVILVDEQKPFLSESEKDSLKNKNILLNRKVLSEIAINDKDAFEKIVKLAVS